MAGRLLKKFTWLYFCVSAWHVYIMFSLRPWQVTFNIIQPLFCTTVRHVIFPRCACIILANPIEIFFWLAVSNPGPKHCSGFPRCHRVHNGISAGLADGQCFDGHHQAKELVAKYTLYEISAPTFMMTSSASSPPWTFQGATWGDWCCQVLLRHRSGSRRSPES